MTLTRVPSHHFAEPIGEALSVTARFGRLLGHVQFLCGVDPVFAGLHRYGEVGDGRSTGGTAHCAHSFHVAGPADVPPHVVVHELGHALHERIGFDSWPDPVTAYARTDQWEAFAEAFTAWVYFGYGDDAVLAQDKATVALFEALS